VKTRGPLLVLVALLALTAAAPAAARRHLTASERNQINVTLDAFVNHAVKRQDVGASYDSVTPAFHGGMSRKEWARGDIPVFPYPAAGTKFHGWTIQYLTGDELGIQLILLPRKGTGVGSGAFPMTLRRVNGRWLVDSIVPGAFFAPEGKPARVVGTYDFGPGPGGDSPVRNGVQRVSGRYAFIPFAVFGFILATIALVALLAMIRNRRYVAAQGGLLPPLPGRIRRKKTPRGA
jgi:hypothetical protein